MSQNLLLPKWQTYCYFIMKLDQKTPQVFSQYYVNHYSTKIVFFPNQNNSINFFKKINALCVKPESAKTQGSVPLNL